MLAPSITALAPDDSVGARHRSARAPKDFAGRRTTRDEAVSGERLEPSITNHPKKSPDPASPTNGALSVEIRQLEQEAEYRACVALQRETWGNSYTETVPATVLRITQRIGGVAAGAFAPDGRLLGFVFGLTGVQKGRLVHWSDLLAVTAEARGRGIGQRLKAFQRDFVRELGVDTIYWTFDPLIASNAHLNLGRLGARVAEYVPDMYGEGGSPLHDRIGTDRLVVAWPTSGEPQRKRVDTAALQDTPVANASPELPDAGTIRIEVPADIFAVRRHAPEDAVRWRETTRRAFLTAHEAGYSVEGFYREPVSGRFYYVLSRPEAADSR